MESGTEGPGRGFVSAGDGESRGKREGEKDAKIWGKGTTEVGKLSKTTVQINPCHLCHPQCCKSIMNSMKSVSFLIYLLLINLLNYLYIPVITTCLKLGLIGIGKDQCKIVLPFFLSAGKCPILIV